MKPTVVESILQDRKMAYAITDLDLNVSEIGGAVDLLYIDQKSWLGHALLDLVPELVGSEAALSEILAGQLPRFELAWINRETAAGETIYLTTIDLPYHHSNGQISGLIHVVDDVTEMGTLKQTLAQQRNELRLLRDQLTRQNLELEAANAELQRLNEMKSVFVSVAAHELRTPLTSINGFVEILLDEDYGPLTHEQREYLELIRDSGRRLLTITKNLLDLTRIEAGRVELVLQPTDLSALVEAVAHEFRPQLEAQTQFLSLRTVPGFPSALCDRVRAKQIIGNLLSNAIKYTPQGGSITISLTRAETEGFLQVSIADNGIGIAPADQDKLFSRFFRAESSAQIKSSGAGLGLYITRSLVELHSGLIWFESKPNQGSTFYVTFPVADP